MPDHLLDLILFWSAILGIVLAISFSAPRYASYLAAPAVLRWFVWPIIAPLVSGSYARLTFWELVLLLPVVALVAVFTFIKAMQGVLESTYGNHVSVRVTAHALISTFRTIGRVLSFIFMWPIRAFKNRKNMDDLLRQWRGP